MSRHSVLTTFRQTSRGSSRHSVRLDLRHFGPRFLGRSKEEHLSLGTLEKVSLRGQLDLGVYIVPTRDSELAKKISQSCLIF